MADGPDRRHQPNIPLSYSWRSEAEEGSHSEHLQPALEVRGGSVQSTALDDAW